MLAVMWHVLVSVTIRWGYMHGNALAFHVCCCLGDYLEMEICKVEQYLYIKMAVFLAEMLGSAMQSSVNHWVIMSYHIKQFQGGRQYSE